MVTDPINKLISPFRLTTKIEFSLGRGHTMIRTLSTLILLGYIIQTEQNRIESNRIESNRTRNEMNAVVC